MNFELLPILALMLDFYQKPLNQERFTQYLQLLTNGSRADMALPIGGFNPMAKGHILEKLLELEALNVEEVMAKTLKNITIQQTETTPIIKVAFNVLDDTQGGWTNRYTTDFDSKFRANALIERRFCVPVFWASESYSEKLIAERTAAYAYRTLYVARYAKPKLLKEYFAQEVFVAQNLFPTQGKSPNEALAPTAAFLQEYENADDYPLLFNFFYGDDASESLGFATFGIGQEANGFVLARSV